MNYGNGWQITNPWGSVAFGDGWTAPGGGDEPGEPESSLVQVGVQVGSGEPVWFPSTPGFLIPDIVAGATVSQEAPKSTNGGSLTGFSMPADPVPDTDVWMKPLLDASGDDLDGFLMPSNPVPGTDVNSADPESAKEGLSAFAMPTISAEAVVS